MLEFKSQTMVLLFYNYSYLFTSNTNTSFEWSALVSFFLYLFKFLVKTRGAVYISDSFFFQQLNSATWNTFLYGLAILAICLCVRLTVTALVCWDMTLKERLFVCCTWTPKSIVEVGGYPKLSFKKLC